MAARISAMRLLRERVSEAARRSRSSLSTLACNCRILGTICRQAGSGLLRKNKKPRAEQLARRAFDRSRASAADCSSHWR